MKKIILATMSLIVFSSGAWAAWAPLARIVLHEPQAVVADVVRLSEFVREEVPPEVVYAQLGNRLMVGRLVGVDLSKPFELVVAEEAGQQIMVARFAIEGDGSAYLEEVGKQLPVREVVSKGVVAFKPTGTSPEPLYFVKLEDGRAVAALKRAHVEALELAPSAPEQEALVLMGRGAPALLAPQALRERLEAELAGAREAIGTSSKEAATMIELYDTLSEKVLANLDVLALNLDIRHDLTLKLHAKAKAGSKLDEVLAAMVPPTTAVSSYSDPRALLSAFGTMAGLQAVMEPYADWIADLYRAMGPPMDAYADSYRELVPSMNEVYSGGYNMVLLPPTDVAPLQMAGVYEVKAPDEARAQIQRMMQAQVEQFGAASGGEAPFKVSMTNAAPTTYEGTAIESFITSFDVYPGAAEKMPALFGDLFKQWTYHTAFVDNYLVYALGDVAPVHQLIDFIKAGPHPARSLPGFADVTGEPLGFWDVDLGRLVAAGMSLAGMPADDTMKAGLRGLTVKEAGGVTSMIRLTREDLGAIKSYAESLIPVFGGVGSPPPQEEGFRFDDDVEWDALPMDEE